MFVYHYEVCSSLGTQAKVERRGNQDGLTIWDASIFHGKEKEKALVAGSEWYRQPSHMQVSDFVLMGRSLDLFDEPLKLLPRKKQALLTSADSLLWKTQLRWMASPDRKLSDTSPLCFANINPV